MDGLHSVAKIDVIPLVVDLLAGMEILQVTLRYLKNSIYNGAKRFWMSCIAVPEMPVGQSRSALISKDCCAGTDLFLMGGV